MERAAPLTDRRGRLGSRQYGSDHPAEEWEWTGVNNGKAVGHKFCKECRRIGTLRQNDGLLDRRFAYYRCSRTEVQRHEG